MGRGLTDKRPFESFLIQRGVSEKDIGWILSKLDSQEYVLDDCHYMARISNNESESKAKESFINRYFILNVRDVNSKNNPNDIFQECIDKKKMWVLLEKNFGVTCIKLPDASVDVDTYLFVCGPNKKCREVTNAQSFMLFSPNEIKEPKKTNPLEMSSLRLAG